MGKAKVDEVGNGFGLVHHCCLFICFYPCSNKDGALGFV